MNRTVVIIVTACLLVACLVSIVILTALHDDTTSVIGWVTTGLFPTAMAAFGYVEASKAKEQSTKAVENTNGILHQAVTEPADGPIHQALAATDTTSEKESK